ncbi:Uncharacterised protein [Bordetella pertussis]|nr:Uncharacterised protein [Bordetella pertussis]
MAPSSSAALRAAASTSAGMPSRRAWSSTSSDHASMASSTFSENFCDAWASRSEISA